MKELTRLMICEYHIKELGHDFMGFHLHKNDQIAFHHLIIPRRDCEKLGLGTGYFHWNGALLNNNQSSHEYLHIIEQKDREIFEYITKQLVEENIQGKIDIVHLRKIDSALKTFEREHYGETTKKGKVLIKDRYFERL